MVSVSSPPNAADGIVLPESPELLSLSLLPLESSLMDFFGHLPHFCEHFCFSDTFPFDGGERASSLPSADCLVWRFSSFSCFPLSVISIFHCISMSLALCQVLKQLST